MPKIAIDISPLSDGNSIRGVGYYTKKLTEALQKEVKSNPKFKDFKIDLIDNCSLKVEDYALVHYPYFDPFSLTLPPKKNIPQVISIHDLIPLQFPEHFPVGIKGKIKWLMQKYRAKKSEYIITISHYSKYVIADILGYPADQIYVTPLAADENYHLNYSSSYLKKIKEKYNLPDKFILNNGDINWNKNIPTLVNACLKLGYPLVIVGGSAIQKNVPTHPWTNELRWLQDIAPKLQHSGALILTGFVPDDDLPGICKLATVYCQPSFAEGFALSVVKAMQVGCPVVYSQQTAVAEVVDYNGVMFDPYSQDSLEFALKKLWKSPSLRHKCSLLGLKRAKIFTWKSTALQTLAVYQMALQETHG